MSILRTHFKKFFLVAVLALLGFAVVGCVNNAEAEEFATKLYIANHTEIKGSFPLSKYVQGNEAVSVTWVSSHPEIIEVIEYPTWDVQYDADLYYKAVVQLPTVETIVTLTATVTFGEQTATRAMPVTVVADEYQAVTVQAAKAAALNTKIRVDGVVVFVSDAGYAVSDATGSMYAYKANHGLKLGDQVTVRGLRAVYNKMPQFGSAVAEKTGEETAGYDPYATATTITLADIVAHDINDNNFYSTLYKVRAVLEKTTDPNDPYRLVDPLNLSVYVGISKYTSTDSKTEMDTLDKKYIDAYVMIYSNYAGKFSLLFAEDKAVQQTLTYTDQNKVDLTIQALQEEFEDSIVTSDITIPATNETYGTTITWESSNLDIVAADGKVTLPDDDTLVTLTFTATINETVTATGTAEITVRKLPVSTVASILPLTPAAATAAKPLVLIEGKVIGHQYRGYWVADATGAILVYVGVNLVVGTNAPEVGTMVQVKGGLTTYGEANSFTSQISPVSYTVLTEATEPTLITPVVKTFDDLFSYNITTLAGAKTAALELYGKPITITGQLVRMGSDNFWKIQDPTNPDRWFRMNNLLSSAALLALRNDVTPPTITITVMLREFYFINDTSAYNNYKAGTPGGVFFLATDIAPSA